jgi:ATP-binding cassette subfamily B protein
LVIKYGMIKESMTVFDGQLGTLPQVQQSSPKKNEFEIFVDGVSYRYDSSIQDILNNISIGITQGERVLIEGRIGSGKSTLLKLIMRYKNPTGGMIYLNGTPYTGLPINDIRGTIGYVPQATMLFNRSIYDNIVYGSEGKYTVEQIYALVDNLQLNHIFERFDEGLLSNVGKNGSKLSGGQRQIVWILRVMLQDPRILLLDEPTASIDEGTKDTIYMMLEVLMKERTVIMVTHDRTLEQHATRIITIKDGTVDRDVRNSL